MGSGVESGSAFSTPAELAKRRSTYAYRRNTIVPRVAGFLRDRVSTQIGSRAVDHSSCSRIIPVVENLRPCTAEGTNGGYSVSHSTERVTHLASAEAEEISAEVCVLVKTGATTTPVSTIRGALRRPSVIGSRMPPSSGRIVAGWWSGRAVSGSTADDEIGATASIDP